MMLRAVPVLLVEDNPADADLVRETLENSKLHVDLHVVANGIDALAFLRREGGFAEAPHPDLILLDLNLPRMDGRQVLSAIKQDEKLRHIPVVILTSSEAEKDVVQTYNLGANCYVMKPVNFKAFQSIVEVLEQFWFTVVKLPPSSN